MKLKNKRRKALYSTMTGLKGKVKHLIPMFYQNGKWYPMNKLESINLTKIVQEIDPKGELK